MGKKSAPPAPDYTKAAEQTSASNQQAQTRADWANRPTVNTPWGQQSWQAQGGVDPSTGQPVTNWTQNITLDPRQQQALDSEMAVQGGRSDIAQGMLGRLNEAYRKPFDWGAMQPYGQVPSGSAGMLGGLGPSGPVQTQLPYAGGVQGRLGNTGPIQGAVPYEGDAGRQRIENALFERMAPQHQQAQAGLENQLRGQGLSRGSEAWSREMQRLGDQQSRERFNALEMGGQEQQRQFGMGLQAGQFGNQAQQQRWQQRLGEGQFGNQAQQQRWQQALGAGQFGNQAQQQQYQQALGAGQFQNQAAGQSFDQNLRAAQYANQLRQQQIGESQLQRSLPLNELNALLSGQQVGMPQMPGFTASQSAGGTNYLGAANAQYNSSLDAYNAAQAQRQGLLSGLGGLAGLGARMFTGGF